MPRIARKKSESGYYHIVLRGINKQNLYYDDEDREVFLSRLKIVKEKVNFDLIAFCLMTNHVHLIIKEKEEIGKIIRTILSSYVYWYNSKYERVGHLFQNRYKSEPIENDEYLLSCIRYIFQNPTKAKLSENIWDYKWSSANLLIKEEKSFVDDGIIKEMLQEQLQVFMVEQNIDKFLEWESKIKLTDEKLQEKIIKELKIKNIYEILQMTKFERDKVLSKIMKIEGANVLQVSRITGVPYHFIRYLE